MSTSTYSIQRNKSGSTNSLQSVNSTATLIGNLESSGTEGEIWAWCCNTRTCIFLSQNPISRIFSCRALWYNDSLQHLKKLKKIQLERSRGGKACKPLKGIFLNPILLGISSFSFPKELWWFRCKPREDAGDSKGRVLPRVAVHVLHLAVPQSGIHCG